LPSGIGVLFGNHSPGVSRAWKDVPLSPVVTRATDETCATEVVLPEYGIGRKLPLDEPVTITFTRTREGELRFACAMKLLQAVIDVP